MTFYTYRLKLFCFHKITSWMCQRGKIITPNLFYLLCCPWPWLFFHRKWINFVRHVYCQLKWKFARDRFYTNKQKFALFIWKIVTTSLTCLLILNLYIFVLFISILLENFMCIFDVRLYRRHFHKWWWWLIYH